MAVFVLDASIALAWCFTDETSSYTESVLDRLIAGSEAAVPSHWMVEVANGIIQGKRKGRVTEHAVQRFLADLSSFHIDIDADSTYSHLNAIREIAERRGLTSYDAAYLELALRLRLPLASLDSGLRVAARAENVFLL